MIRKWFGKKQQPQVTRPSLFRKLAVESLEKREVLAGSVTLAFAGGNLYLTGDAAGNSVNINVNGPNTVQITGTATTIINNTAGSFLVTGGVYANLNGGNDTVTVLGAGSLTGDLVINLGTGNGTVTKAPSATAVTLRDLFVTTAAGNDIVNIDGLNARNINVNTGTGNTDITFTDTTTTGYANLINGTSTGAQSVSLGTVDLLASTIGTGLLVSLGNGASAYSTNLNNYAVGGTINVVQGSGTGGASISLSTGTAGSSVFLTNGNNASNTIQVITATFGASSNFRNGTATGSNVIVVSGVTAASPASHTFANGASSSNNIILGPGTGNTLTGPVNLSNTGAAGGINQILIFQGAFGSSLNANNYAGNSAINVIQAGLSGPVTVGGILTATNGASTAVNQIILDNFTGSGSSATLSNGTSANNVAVIGSSAPVSLAGTVNVLNAASTVSNFVSMDRYTGLGNLFISNGTSTFTTSVSIAGTTPSSVAGGLTITNQSAPFGHIVTLNGLAVTGAPGAAIYNNGAGTNTVDIGTSAAVSVTAGLTYIDGTGNATVNLAQLAVGGALNYFDNGGNDNLTIGSALGFSVGGVTNISTSAGLDNVTIGTTAASFGGKLNVNLGADDDQLTIGAAAALFGGPFANNFLFDGGPGAADFWTISKTAIDGINPLTAATALQIYNFEGLNTPTA